LHRKERGAAPNSGVIEQRHTDQSHATADGKTEIVPIDAAARISDGTHNIVLPRREGKDCRGQAVVREVATERFVPHQRGESWAGQAAQGDGNNGSTTTHDDSLIRQVT